MIWSHVIAMSLICGGAVAVLALVGESAISALRARSARRRMAAAILTPDAGLDTSVAAACGCHLCLTAIARDISRARTGRLCLTERAVNAALLAMTPDLSDVPGWDHLAGLYLIPGDDR